MRTVEVSLLTFGELSKEAKEKALERGLDADADITHGDTYLVDLVDEPVEQIK